MHESLQWFDKSVAEMVRLLPAWVSPAMHIISFIGLPVVVIGVAVVVAGVSIFKNIPRIALASAATVVALGGNTIIKHLVQRTRPDTLYVDNMKIHSYSFPSGHTFGSTVVYGLLAYLAYVYLPAPWNVIMPALLLLLIFLIGISRIYLGAHFPSDVAVGWLLGGLSLLLIILIIKPL